MKFFITILLLLTFTSFGAEEQYHRRIKSIQQFYTNQEQQLGELLDSDLISVRFHYFESTIHENISISEKGAILIQFVREDEYLLSSQRDL